MGHPTKIATCNYCGTRAALVLRGSERHELTCSACGAPLHDLKMMPAAPKKPTKPARDYGISHAPPPKKMKQVKKKKPKKKKRFGDFFEDAFDFIEDIFD